MTLQLVLSIITIVLILLIYGLDIRWKRLQMKLNKSFLEQDRKQIEINQVVYDRIKRLEKNGNSRKKK